MLCMDVGDYTSGDVRSIRHISPSFDERVMGLPITTHAYAGECCYNMISLSDGDASPRQASSSF